MASHSIDGFVKSYVQALHDQTAAVFAGAGLSIAAGMVNWKDLMRSIASDVGLDVDREEDLVSLAQFHVNERGGRNRINQALVKEFSERAKPTKNHSILCALPIRTYWTTNYDTLIEESLRRSGKIPDVKTNAQSLTLTVPGRSAVVYKMHGDVSHPAKAVVTRDDYEVYDSTERRLFSTALQGDLVSKTFLFLGFSFSDPNLAYILARIRVLLGENRREHYCLLRHVQRSDFSSAAEYQYAKAKQDLQVRDLTRYGIVGLLLDSFEEYTDVLTRIKRMYLASRVFVSGSSADYNPFDAHSGPMLVKEVSKQLVNAGFGIVSGFGLGVGQFVLNGVLEALETQGTRVLEERLILRPFPQDIADPDERKRRWISYRRDMLSNAGIAIFLFGNKMDKAGNLTTADGMEEEFTIAVEQGSMVIPVGCTGGMSSGLFDKVLENYGDYHPLRGYKTKFKELGKYADSFTVAKRVVEIAETIRGMT